eukprot:evm.model.scf_660EXC.6 EVM.evm.TU.scf_660EXC.6   scf_660EXC:62242-63051(-)
MGPPLQAGAEMGDVGEDVEFEACDEIDERAVALVDTEFDNPAQCSDRTTNKPVRTPEGGVWTRAKGVEGGSKIKIRQTIGAVRRNGRTVPVISNWQGQVAWLRVSCASVSSNEIIACVRPPPSTATE